MGEIVFWGISFKNCKMTMFMNQYTKNCSEITLWKHITNASCQTSKWCSHFPFMLSESVCYFVQTCRKCGFVRVCVTCTCALDRLPGVLFKLCIKAWLTSQHTSRSLPAMTLWRHRWDLDVTYHRSGRVWKSSPYICMATYCSNSLYHYYLW